MTPITVRRATSADLDAILRFQQGVVDAERPYDSTLKDGAIRYYDFEQLLNSEQVHFVIAEADGAAIGCGFARIDTAKPYVKYDRAGYLGLMFVEPAYRGRGVNSAVIVELKRWCRARGVQELRLEVYPDNASAVKAYEKAGFMPQMLEMRMPLD
jgi:ribosomal protein S18 acetylase RimI-like enzyme